MNLLGAMYSAVMFLGGTNTSSVQSVVAVERTVFYREKAAGMYSPLPYAFAQVKRMETRLCSLKIVVNCETDVCFDIRRWRLRRFMLQSRRSFIA